MILEVKDCAYFGLYYIEILKSMKMLRELDIHAERETVIPWLTDGDRHLDLLMTAFAEAMDDDPGWECPMVEIYDKETGGKMRVIEGGTKIT